MPFDPQYRPETRILQLGDGFYDPVAVADFPETVLRFRNDRAAGEVGLAGLSDDEWVRHFGRFAPLPGSLPEPLALRYHGHQFQVYNPDIGDGRGFLFAQLRDGAGRLMDLGTKGSGQTPWSRFGDGRLTLKGGVREILATEMLQALGVRTSRTFGLIETGEQLHRGDEPSPTRSGVLVRLSHGHIRIGTFQRLAWFKDAERMRALVRYCLAELYGEQPGDRPEVRLLELVIAGTARLAARYMAAGFVHGVLNSDNIAITAESFDYGPWRFAPTWEPGFTAAYFDQQGLYAFGRQAQAIHWDVVQLAVALRLLVDADTLVPVIERFPDLYERELAAAILWRLGLAPRGEDEDLALLGAVEQALARPDVEIDRFFFEHRGGRAGDAATAGYEAVPGALDHSYWEDDAPCSMHIDEVESIWAAIAERDDWAPLHAKVAAARRMGDALAGRSGAAE